MGDVHLRDLFRDDPGRGDRLVVEAAGLVLDFSKQRVTAETLDLLCALAAETGVEERREAMFRGERINVTEDRPVLHVALRLPREASLVVDGVDVVREVHEVLDRMAVLADGVRSGSWLGYTGRPIRNVVNIGIGGSDLGPAMAYEALRAYASRDLRFRFVSNVDGTDFVEATRDLDPAETLFVVASKTFTTLETMTNARTARDWLLAGIGADRAAVARHFVAVSSNLAEVEAFGIDPSNVFGFWDWVGGRYSMDSAIGLSTMVAIGPVALPRAARRLPRDGRALPARPPWIGTCPRCSGCSRSGTRPSSGQAAWPCSRTTSTCSRFPAYLQQLTMESNGKSVTLGGQPVGYDTGPVTWGEPGTNGQHSFYQLLHQGTRVVPCDLIAFARSLNPVGGHHDLLTANVLAQAEALAFGRTADEVRAEGVDEALVPHRVFEGNRPSNVLLADELTPFALGTLVALYEHAVFTQGVVWDVNSFDQWGVELGKQLAQRIASELAAPDDVELAHDSSTNALIRRYRALRRDEAAG